MMIIIIIYLTLLTITITIVILVFMLIFIFAVIIITIYTIFISTREMSVQIHFSCKLISVEITQPSEGHPNDVVVC